MTDDDRRSISRIERAEDRHGVTKRYLADRRRVKRGDEECALSMGAKTEDGGIFRACAAMTVSGVYIIGRNS